MIIICNIPYKNYINITLLLLMNCIYKVLIDKWPD